MKVDLDTTGMVHLICGTVPTSELRRDLEKKNLGFEDDDGSWKWDIHNLRKLENTILYNLYKQIRF